MDYRVGDLLCVPANGVGSILSIGSVTLDGRPVEMVEIYLEVARARVWVPLDRMETSGVRPPMSHEKVEETLEIIRSPVATERAGTWNRRRRRYQEQLAGNEPAQLAQMLGELAAARRKKVLAFGDRRLFEQVRDQLIHEIALVWDAPLQLVEERMTLAMAGS